MIPGALAETTMRTLVLLPCLLAPALAQDRPVETTAADPFVVYVGGSGPGAGTRIVFVTGDEEYRSEQGMPQLARILARLGCHCTVLFAIDPKTGTIAPDVRDNIPGLHLLAAADLMVLFTRFRDLPDAQMQHVVDYVESGRPIVALRTATHAFAPSKERKHARWSWNDTEWHGGFGRQVLGETWIAHHGAHGEQSARGVVAPDAAGHPILRGIGDGAVWDPADVYAVRLPLPDGCTPILLGQVLDGMSPTSPPARVVVDPNTHTVRDPNAPMMPLAWTRTWRAPNGKDARVFVTTMGSAQAFTQEGSRRLLVNACLWALGRDDAITKDLDVSPAGDYRPSPFGFGTHQRGVRPADLAADVRGK